MIKDEVEVKLNYRRGRARISMSKYHNLIVNHPILLCSNVSDYELKRNPYSYGNLPGSTKSLYL